MVAPNVNNGSIDFYHITVRELIAFYGNVYTTAYIAKFASNVSKNQRSCESGAPTRYKK